VLPLSNSIHKAPKAGSNMATYIFYGVVFFALLLGTALYLARDRWLPHITIPQYLYHRLPSSFASDIESGLTSDDFDLSGNMMSGDSRAGLDEQGKKEVRKIMRNRKVGFDEARRIFTERKFASNNIGPDGRPRDPKFVSFS